MENSDRTEQKGTIDRCVACSSWSKPCPFCLMREAVELADDG